MPHLHETDLAAEVARLRAERDALAQALGERDLQLRMAFDNAPAGVSVITAADAKYRYVNRAFCDFFGLPAEHFLDGDAYELWQEITHPDDFAAEHAHFARIAAGEIDGYQLRKRYVVRGEPRWALVAVQVTRDPQGRLDHVVGHLIDIHDQKVAEEQARELEERLQQSQKLEALGQLAGGIAHDFNNRLLVVMGYGELLKKGLPNEGPLREYASLVVESAERSAELTRQLLAFGRRQSLSPRAFDATAALERMRRMLERLLDERLELVTVLGGSQPVFCDPGQFEQVVMNLVLNARDAMPSGGRVTIEIRGVPSGSPERPEELASGDYTAVSVSDLGSGIPDEVLPRIFEPFFTTKPKGLGTGLGLATVEGIVRQSGGAVRVRTVPGQGTTFTVFLPADGERPPALLARCEPQQELLSTAPGGKISTILVCDDDAAVRKLVRDVLALVPCEVLEARSGREALELTRRHAGSIDLVITDVVMPGLDGPALLAELRTQYPELPALMMSGYPDSPSTPPLAAETFLAKPFLPGELILRVRALIDSRGRIAG